MYKYYYTSSTFELFKGLKDKEKINKCFEAGYFTVLFIKLNIL